MIPAYNLKSLITPAKNKLFLTLICIIGSSVCSVSLPIILKKLIDGLTLHTHIRTLSILFILYAFVLIFHRLLSEAQFISYSSWECGIAKTLFNNIFTFLFYNKADFFNKTLHGEITSKIFQAVSGLELFLFDIVFKILPMAIEFLLILSSVTFIFNIHMSITLFLGIIIYSYCMHKFNNKLILCQNVIRNNHIKAQGVATDLICSWKDIKLTNSYTFASRLLNKATHTQIDQTAIFYKKRGIYGFIQSIPICITILVANYQAISSYTKGCATIGSILLVNNYLFQLLRPLESFSIVFRSLTKNYADFISLNDIVNHEKDKAYIPIKQRFNHIRINNLRIDGIFNNINLVIKKGEKIAIIGPSGSGKTTLLNTIAEFNPHYDGEILINDQNIKQSIHTIKNNVAYLRSDARLIHETIKNNISLENNNNIRSALQFSYIADKVYSLKQGEESIISEQTSLLSAGEIQRLKIARTMHLCRDIEIYDEATSSLNQELEEMIIKNIIANKNKTVIFVTHRQQYLSLFDKVYQLKNGSLMTYQEESIND